MLVCERPVFIVGAPRSGTSVLAWSLAEHGRFWTSGETDILYELFGDGYLELVFRRVRDRSLSWFHEQGLSYSELLRALGLGFNAVFSSRSGERRWIDQSPSYTMMLPELAEMFPGAQFVHLWRDGREVVRSMLHSGFAEPWAVDFRQACRVWRCCVELAAEFTLREPTRCTTVRYADLVAEPELTFAGLFEFLGERPEQASATFLRENRINRGLQAEGGSADGTTGGPRGWTAEQVEIFLEETWPVLERYDLPERELLAPGAAPPQGGGASAGVGERCDTIRMNGVRAAIARGGTIRDLEALVDERTAWAMRTTADVRERDETIVGLQRALEEVTEWAQTSARAVEERDATIRELQRPVRRRPWRRLWP